MTVQEYGQFRMFEKGIGNEKFLMKIESQEASENLVCFDLKFCRIVEIFEFFEGLILEHLDVIPSSECFVSSFDLITLSSIDFHFFVMNEMIKKILLLLIREL
jgi:hypothetical protein